MCKCSNLTPLHYKCNHVQCLLFKPLLDPQMSSGQKLGTVTTIQHGRRGILFRFRAQATEVSLFQCIPIGCGTLSLLPARAVTHVSRYMHWGQHYF